MQAVRARTPTLRAMHHHICGLLTTAVEAYSSQDALQSAVERSVQEWRSAAATRQAPRWGVSEQLAAISKAQHALTWQAAAMVAADAGAGRRGAAPPPAQLNCASLPAPTARAMDGTAAARKDVPGPGERRLKQVCLTSMKGMKSAGVRQVDENTQAGDAGAAAAGVDVSMTHD